MLIREFQSADALALHAVFHSSVHTLGAACYSAAQLEAWAPASFNVHAWSAKMCALRPFLAVQAERVLGYGDLGAGGYIDHLFVAGDAARRGIGSALLRHIAACAQERGITALTADVSLCAQAFFAQHGFELIERRTVVLHGVALANARMRRAAVAAAYSTSSL